MALCEENSLVSGEFHSQGQWRNAVVFSLICTWQNGWANHRDAGDLGRRRAYYDVIAMLPGWLTLQGRDMCRWFTFDLVNGMVSIMQIVVPWTYANLL